MPGTRRSIHYILECFGPDDQERAGIHTVHGLHGLNWMLGSRFRTEPQSPIQITLDADHGVMVPMFNSGILLFSDQLLNAFYECGVDNLDVYAAELFNPLTKSRFTNYKAVNIVGLASVADLGKSDFRAHGTPLIDVDFDSVAIDSAKATNLLVFRLAEAVSAIVVHEKVRQGIDAHGIVGLDWIHPGDWIG